MAYERVSLYGLPLVVQRKVNFGSIDPVISRELFIRHALVQGEYRSRATFALHNQRIREELAELEAKARRPDLLIEEQAVFDYFDARIPQNIMSGASFERWLKKSSGEQADSLKLNREQLLRRDDSELCESQYPDHLDVRSINLPVHYRFTPGHQADGLCVDIPIAALNQFDVTDFEWLVPGLLHEKIVQLIKSLPKQWRKHFVPAPDFAQACIDKRGDYDGSLMDYLAAELLRMTGIEIPADAWRLERLTPHVFAYFQILDEDGKCLDENSDLALLQAKHTDRANRDFHKHGMPEFTEREVTAWNFGDLEEAIELSTGTVTMRGYPALSLTDNKVILKLFDHQESAVKAHRVGVLKLFENSVNRAVKDIKRGLPDIQQQCLWFTPLGKCEALTGDIMQAVLDAAFLPGNDLPRTEQDFNQNLENGRPKLMEIANQIGGWSAAALSEYHQLKRQLKSNIPPYALPVASEINQQLDHLIYPGFVSKTPVKWLPHLARFIKAAQMRFENCGTNTQGDRQKSKLVNSLLDRYQKTIERNQDNENLQEFFWLIEELRVSLFAQVLKTSTKVSEQRLEKIWQEIK
jgi:ATP-dependent helicase HrpA